MKRSTLLLLLWLALASPASQAQTVRNGGFEAKDPERDRPQHWHHNARNAGPYVAVTWDSTVAHSGRFSVSIAFARDIPEEKK